MEILDPLAIKEKLDKDKLDSLGVMDAMGYLEHLEDKE